MSTLVLDGTTAGALAEAVSAYGMSTVAVDAPVAIARLSGPILVTEGSRAGAALPEAIIAMVDTPGSEADEALLAVAAALANAIEGLTVAPARPAADLGGVVAGFPTISEALAITRGPDTVGVVLWIADRRADHAGPSPESTAASSAGQGATVRATPSLAGLSMLREVELEVSVELGRTQMTLADVLGLHIGSVVELDRPAGSPVDLRVNGTLLARGEVVVIDGEYAVRISEVVEPEAPR